MTAKESAEEIAQHFARISQKYAAIDLAALPTFLPSLPPPQITQMTVYQSLLKQKKTKTTFEIDIPHSLKKEFALGTIISSD